MDPDLAGAAATAIRHRDAVIGLVINPVAGIGGPAGLKGSDGERTQAIAAGRGAVSRSVERAGIALAALAEARPDPVVLTASGPMGEDAVRRAGLVADVCVRIDGPTTGASTTTAVRTMIDSGAELIIFAGGDGTDVRRAEPARPGPPQRSTARAQLETDTRSHSMMPRGGWS